MMDLCVGTPVDELKGHCAGYAEKEEANWTGILMNRYICRHVEQQNRERVDLNGLSEWKSENEHIGSWTGTSMGMYTSSGGYW